MRNLILALSCLVLHLRLDLRSTLRIKFGWFVRSTYDVPVACEYLSPVFQELELF